MVYIGSLVSVIDNSGAREARCINILGKSHKSKARVGDIIVVAVKRVIPNKKVHKGSVHKAIVVKLAGRQQQYGNLFIKFQMSSVVLLNQRSLLLGTRVLSSVSKELRNRGFIKIISLAPIIA